MIENRESNLKPSLQTLEDVLDMSYAAGQASSPDRISTKQAFSTSYCQWSVLANDNFSPSGPKIAKLPAGVYKIYMTQQGPLFEKIRVITDTLIELDDSASQRVLASMKHFWSSKREYEKRNIVYKRGILLYGPAGSGKTSIVNMLIDTLVAMDGIVFVCQHPSAMSDGLSALRRIEQDRNIIVIYEDVDELIDQFNEHALLSLLDGEHQVANVVSVATTNFPDKLGARIVNRPSRFDELIEVGMPNEKAREKYIRHILKDENCTEADIAQWVKETDKFGVAHIKELAVAVFCLKQPFDTVLKRLKSMQYQPKSVDEFQRLTKGFKYNLVVEDTTPEETILTNQH